MDFDKEREEPKSGEKSNKKKREFLSVWAVYKHWTPAEHFSGSNSFQN